MKTLKGLEVLIESNGGVEPTHSHLVSISNSEFRTLKLIEQSLVFINK